MNPRDAASSLCEKALQHATPGTPSNNSSDLDGPALGAGTASNDELRKPIRVDLLQPEPRINTGQAYALRLSPGDPFISIAFTITNVGPTESRDGEDVGAPFPWLSVAAYGDTKTIGQFTVAPAGIDIVACAVVRSLTPANFELS